MTLITGNTYPVRERIKALGGIWDRDAKGWRVPDEVADHARAIVAEAGPEEPRAPRRSRNGRRTRGGYVSNVYRFSSEAEVYVNKNGRCIDAPCCGCCS